MRVVTVNLGFSVNFIAAPPTAAPPARDDIAAWASCEAHRAACEAARASEGWGFAPSHIVTSHGEMIAVGPAILERPTWARDGVYTGRESLPAVSWPMPPVIRRR